MNEEKKYLSWVGFLLLWNFTRQNLIRLIAILLLCSVDQFMCSWQNTRVLLIGLSHLWLEHTKYTRNEGKKNEKRRQRMKKGQQKQVQK